MFYVLSFLPSLSTACMESHLKVDTRVMVIKQECDNDDDDDDQDDVGDRPTPSLVGSHGDRGLLA